MHLMFESEKFEHFRSSLPTLEKAAIEYDGAYTIYVLFLIEKESDDNAKQNEIRRRGDK